MAGYRGTSCQFINFWDSKPWESKLYHISYIIYIWYDIPCARHRQLGNQVRCGHSFKKLQRQSCPTPRLVWVSVMKHDIKLPVFCAPWRSKQQDLCVWNWQRGLQCCFPVAGHCWGVWRSRKTASEEVLWPAACCFQEDFWPFAFFGKEVTL